MIFLILAASLLALLIIFLCMPLEIELDGNFQDKPVVEWRIFFFFKKLVWKIGGGGEKAADQRPAPGSSRSGWIGLTEALELAQIEDMLERVFKLIKKLFNSIRVHHIETDLRLSMGDDYDTGMLFGLLIPLQLYVQPKPGYKIMVQPAFEEDLLLSGCFNAGWRVRPITVLIHCLDFACSRPAWKAARQVMGNRCKKRY